METKFFNGEYDVNEICDTDELDNHKVIKEKILVTIEYYDYAEDRAKTLVINKHSVDSATTHLLEQGHRIISTKSNAKKQTTFIVNYRNRAVHDIGVDETTKLTFYENSVEECLGKCKEYFNEDQIIHSIWSANSRKKYY